MTAAVAIGNPGSINQTHRMDRAGCGDARAPEGAVSSPDHIHPQTPLAAGIEESRRYECQ